jgi:type I restriction enzyme R subunit
MLARNPLLMDIYRKYQEIIADYNREKDRATVEETFAKVMKLVAEMDDEAQRHVREGLTEEELAFFDLLTKENISKTDRERVKQASKGLLATLHEQLATMPAWTRNATTQAEVKVLILDTLYASLPRPPFTDEEADTLAEKLYGFIWQRSEQRLRLLPAA